MAPSTYCVDTHTESHVAPHLLGTHLRSLLAKIFDFHVECGTTQVLERGITKSMCWSPLAELARGRVHSSSSPVKVDALSVLRKTCATCPHHTKSSCKLLLLVHGCGCPVGQVLHAMLGVVRSPRITTFMQVSSRIVLLWGFMWAIPSTQGQLGSLLCITSWACVEIPR